MKTEVTARNNYEGAQLKKGLFSSVKSLQRTFVEKSAVANVAKEQYLKEVLKIIDNLAASKYKCEVCSLDTTDSVRGNNRNEVTLLTVDMPRYIGWSVQKDVFSYSRYAAYALSKKYSPSRLATENFQALLR